MRRWIKQGHYAAAFGYATDRWGFKRLLALSLRARPNIRESLGRLIFFLPPRPGGRVLDVGCGDGASLAELKGLGWEVEGLDFDFRAAAAAASRGVSVRVGRFEEQDYPNASFDAVSMSHVLEHVRDPLGLLRGARRILRPGGRLVVLTPNVAGLGHRQFGSCWRGLEPPRHLQIFSPSALEQAATKAGLRISVLRSLAGGARYIHAESCRIAGAPTTEQEAAAFEREERRALRRDPWAGEELWLVAEPA